MRKRKTTISIQWRRTLEHLNSDEFIETRALLSQHMWIKYRIKAVWHFTFRALFESCILSFIGSRLCLLLLHHHACDHSIGIHMCCATCVLALVRCFFSSAHYFDDNSSLSSTLYEWVSKSSIRMGQHILFTFQFAVYVLVCAIEICCWREQERLQCTWVMLSLSIC